MKSILIAAAFALSIPAGAAAQESSPTQSASAAETLRQQASALEREGNLPSAIELRERALALDAERLGAESLELLDEQVKLVSLYISIDDTYRAEELIEAPFLRALETYGPHDERTMNAGGTYVQLLRAMSFQSGAEQIALLFLQAAQQRYGEHDNWTRIWKFTYANVLVDGRQYAQAEPILDDLAVNFQAQGIDEAEFAMRKSLAFTRFRLGKYDEALFDIDRALLLARGNSGLAAAHRSEVLGTKARILLARGSGDDSDQALEIFEGLFTKHNGRLAPEAVQMQAIAKGYGASLLRAGRAADAAPIYAEQLQLAEARWAPDDPMLVVPLEDYAATLIELPDRRAEALPYLKRAAGLIRYRREKGGVNASERAINDQNRNFEQRVFADQLTAEWASANPARPISAMPDSAFAAIQDAMSGVTDLAVVRKGAQERARRGNPEVAALLEERAGLTEQIAELRMQAANAPAASTAMGSGSDARSEDTVIGKLTLAGNRLDEIDGRINTLAPNYFAQTTSRPVSIAEAQALMKPDEAALFILPTKFGTYSVLATDDAVSWHRSDRSGADIAADVSGLRQSLDQTLDKTFGDYEAAFDRAVAYDLYRALVQPFESELASRKHLFFIAKGAMAALPPAVLVTEEPEGNPFDAQALRGTAWLDKRFTLAQLPSLRALAFLRDRAGTARTEGRTALAGFGEPVLLGTAAGANAEADDTESAALSQMAARSGGMAQPASLRALDPLPGTAVELRAIRDVLGLGEASGAILLREQATETAVKAADLSATNVVAFATHGLLPGELEGQAEPGLVLTPPPDGAETALDDGYLTASEITALDLSAEWVILSACNTAAGGKPGGEGLSGLARAFFEAGAQNLLATHWRVRDDIASELVPQTLGMGLGENAETDRAQALALTTRTIREDAGDETRAHPAAWAPFTLVGDR